jgi:hypothetical protein
MPLQKAHAASIGNSLRILSQRAQQKRGVRQSHWCGQRLSIAPSAPAPRVFASCRPKSCASSNTTEMIASLWTSCKRLGRLLFRAAVCGSYHQKCNSSGRRRLVPDDGLFPDRARSFGTKGAQPHLKGTPRPRVSDAATISSYAPVDVMAPLVPSRRQARTGKDQRWKKSELVGASVEALLVRGHARHCAN